MIVKCNQIIAYDKKELPCQSDRCCLCCEDYKRCKVKCTYLSLEQVYKSGCPHRIVEQLKEQTND